jgi:hypothetical protein
METEKKVPSQLPIEPLVELLRSLAVDLILHHHPHPDQRRRHHVHDLVVPSQILDMQLQNHLSCLF